MKLWEAGAFESPSHMLPTIKGAPASCRHAVQCRLREGCGGVVLPPCAGHAWAPVRSGPFQVVPRSLSCFHCRAVRIIIGLAVHAMQRVLVASYDLLHPVQQLNWQQGLSGSQVLAEA